MSRVQAYSHEHFDEICATSMWNDDNVENLTDYAFISIVGTKDVQKYYLEDKEEHWFERNHPNVLNIAFDDVTQDRTFGDGYKAKALTEKQAKQIVDFIEKNLGRNILIHCRAGISRSQAIVRFVLETYPDMYIKDDSHNVEKANIDVLAKLKRIIWERKQPKSFLEKLFGK